jgi:hypothetical protein
MKWHFDTLQRCGIDLGRHAKIALGPASYELGDGHFILISSFPGSGEP